MRWLEDFEIHLSFGDGLCKHSSSLFIFILIILASMWLLNTSFSFTCIILTWIRQNASELLSISVMFSAGQGKMQLGLDLLVLLEGRQLTFPPWGGSTKQYTYSQLVLGKAHSETSRPLRNALRMSLLMLLRDPLTGLLTYMPFGVFAFAFFIQEKISSALVFSMHEMCFFSTCFKNLCSLCLCDSYAIKKKDEIERVAKANRWTNSLWCGPRLEILPEMLAVFFFSI